MLHRRQDARLLFSIIWTALASSIYFALGVVAGYALGLTPAVFMLAGFMFALAFMTYAEGSAMHQDRAGSTVFARYAFNEVRSFIAGWAMLLDYVILLAATSFSATNYLAPIWSGFGHGTTEAITCLVILAYVAVRNVRGFSTTRSRRIAALVVADIAVQVGLIILGIALLYDPGSITASIDLGSTPSWADLIVAVGIATVVSTGLESAAGLAGEVEVTKTDLRRMVGFGSLTVFVVYGGIALVAMSAQPVVNGKTELSGRYNDAPFLGISAAFSDAWLRDGTKYLIALAASVTLVAAANSAMLGLSRLAYALATNRQIPSALGRLHPRRFTPWVVIVLAALIAGALTIPQDLDLLLGLYAFGALLSLTRPSEWRMLAPLAIMRLACR